MAFSGDSGKRVPALADIATIARGKLRTVSGRHTLTINNSRSFKAGCP